MDNVLLGICGGFHDPHDTEGVFTLWAKDPTLRSIPARVLGADGLGAPLSAHALRQSLESLLRSPLPAPSSTFVAQGALPDPVGPQDVDPAQGDGRVDLILWAFSAGCVGAVALAHHWHCYRGRVRAIFLVDGWGVPWTGEAPLHRLSHDSFTHRSSRWLGAGRADFFAQPGVPHRQLWRSPQTVLGMGRLPSSAAAAEPSQPLSAADFLVQWTQFYVLSPQSEPGFLRG